jgi:uncharacterized protein with PIN domain
MEKLKEELSNLHVAISDVWQEVQEVAATLGRMQVEARCTKCKRISYVDPPEHHQHRQVDCEHCGHMYWLGAIYISNDRVPDLSCKLIEAELAVKKGKGRQP